MSETDLLALPATWNVGVDWFETTVEGAALFRRRVGRVGNARGCLFGTVHTGFADRTARRLSRLTFTAYHRRMKVRNLACDRLTFAGALLLSWCVGPAMSAALDSWLGSVRAQAAGVLVAVIWFAAFMFAGAFAGNAVAGRRGQFAFSVAFALVPIAAVAALLQSFAFHDNVYWRPNERILDIALFNVAYPLTFAGIGAVGVAIVSRSWRKASSAALACAASGVVGGVLFSAAVSFLQGYAEALAVLSSFGIPAYLCARPIHRRLQH